MRGWEDPVFHLTRHVVHRGRVITRAASVAVAVTALVAVAVGLPQAAPAAAAAGDINATVFFSEPLDVSRVRAILQGRRATIIDLQFSYTSNGREWSGGVTTGDLGTADQVAARFATEMRAMAADQENQLVGLEAVAAVKAGIASLRASAAAGPDLAARNITAARIEANASVLASLLADTRIRTIRPDRERRTQASAKVGTFAAPNFTHIPRDNWVPDDVYVSLQPSAQGGRYVSQDFIWNAGRSLWFGDRDGYEPDFYLSNNLGTYLARDEWPISRIPIVLSWSTTLPASDRYGNPKYIATRQGDDTSKVWSFNVGTPGAEYISSGTWYNSYMRLNNGDASTDNGYIQPQLKRCLAFPGEPCDTFSEYVHDTCYAEYSIAVPAWQWHWNRFSGPWPCV